jgi:serine/threonine protein kinase
MKVKLTFNLLKKKSGGRLRNIDTYIAVCDQKTHENSDAWLYIEKSIKTPESEDMFGHVAIGQMIGTDDKVVVKVYNKNDFMLQKELDILRTLFTSKCNNIIRLICDFQCSRQNKIIWNTKIQKKQHVCHRRLSNSHIQSDLHFLVLEYIPHGNIGDFLEQHPEKLSFEQFTSFVRQSILCLLEVYERFAIHHGDIHSGNILINFIEEQTHSYKISNKTFDIETHGCEPIFIDFGRANRSSKSRRSRNEVITNSDSESSYGSRCSDICWTLQEILIVLQMLLYKEKSKRKNTWLKILYEKLTLFEKSKISLVEYAEIVIAM